MTSTAFECRSVSKAFHSGRDSVVAVEKLSFAVRRSEIACLIGPTGCGKTSVLKMIGGLLRPDRGEVILGSAPDGEALRRSIVFQEHGLFPWMSVLDNVAFGLEARGVARAERLERAAHLVAAMGLEAFDTARPHQLSVGMRQRVGIARALLTEPDILLMDEPFGSLDAQTRRVLQNELLAIWQRSRRTILFVTHDIEEAVRLGDRVLVLSSRPGRLIEDVTIEIDRPHDHTPERRALMVELEDRLWRMIEPPASRDLGQESAE